MENYRNPIERPEHFSNAAGNALQELHDAELDNFSGGFCSSNGDNCTVTVECTQITELFGGSVTICCG